MSVITPAAPTTAWTEERVSALVLDLLADLLSEAREDLQFRLTAAGSGMPVDSLDMMDIIAEFRQRTGITIRRSKLRPHHMRSVRAFAGFVSSEAAR